MNKLEITKAVYVKHFNQDEFLTNQADILKDLNAIVDSFDYDVNLEYTKDYLCNLNSDIFLNNSKVDIFILYCNNEPVSFVVMCNNNVDLFWTNYEYAKLGYATVLIRAMSSMFAKEKKYNLTFKIDENNLIFSSLLESFKKVEGIKFIEKLAKNGKKTIKFSTKNINFEEILTKIKEMTI